MRAPAVPQRRDTEVRRFNLRNCRIGVVGLGYLGLPLAAALGRCFDTVGFDIKPGRIAELKEGRDSTLEVTAEELAGARRLSFASSLKFNCEFSCGYRP
jgi:UDP-N-acetyl-D-galactosamine dehydrogenase